VPSGLEPTKPAMHLQSSPSILPECSGHEGSVVTVTVVVVVVVFVVVVVVVVVVGFNMHPQSVISVQVIVLSSGQTHVQTSSLQVIVLSTGQAQSKNLELPAGDFACVGQSWQLASLVAAFDGEYLPTGQSVQTLLPSREYVPALH